MSLRISVSQLKNYTSCEMKWYLDKVENIKQPTTHALEFGKKFHELLELAFHGKDFSYILKESPSLNALYKANEDYINSLWQLTGFSELELKADNFLGYVDLLEVNEESNILIIRDYKTVSDWKYALSRNQLASDLQMNVYAYLIHQMPQYKGFVIYLEHVQFNKNTNLKKIVNVIYNPEYGIELWKYVIENYEKMKGTADINDITSVPQRKGRPCQEFGGCPYRGYCLNGQSLEDLRMSLFSEERGREELDGLTPEKRISEIKNEIGGTMDLKQKLQMLKNKKTTEPEPVVVETPTPTPTPTPVEVEEALKTRGRPKKEVVKSNFKSPPAPITQTTLVLIGCRILDDEECKSASDILHEKYVVPLLVHEKIPHISCSNFNQATKDLAKFGKQILDELAQLPYFTLDFKRPVDSLVYTLIVDMQQLDRFKLVRSVF